MQGTNVDASDVPGCRLASFLPIPIEPTPVSSRNPGPRDIEAMATLAVQGLNSPHSRRGYRREILAYLASGRPLNREGVQAHMNALRARGLGTVGRNIALAAVKLFAREAWIRGELAEPVLTSIERIRGVPVRGARTGNWLDLDGVKRLLAAAEAGENGTRNAAIVACMAGCGLRRAEVCSLAWSQWQERGGRWVWLDVEGKGGRVRTVPAPRWVARAVDLWRGEANGHARVFPVTHDSIWLIVQSCAERAGFSSLAPHDLRRTYARLAREGGASIEQIQQCLGHASVQTTERYLGSSLELREGKAAGDHIRL